MGADDQSWIDRLEAAYRRRSPRRPPPDPPELRDPEWLRREHHDRGRSLVDIGREVGRDSELVARRFRQHGITIRRPRTFPQLWEAGRAA